jgi:hypothetical protein
MALFIGGIIYSLLIVIAVKLVVQVVDTISKAVLSKVNRLLFDNMKYVL